MHRHISGRFWIACAALVLFLGLSAAVWRERFATYHFAEVRPGVLYRDGNRNMREFATACRNGRIRTVVMLNDDQELIQPPFANETAFCQSQGIQLIRIPVTLGGWPSSADVRRFLQIVEDPNNHPVLVHCAQGVRRTGMMVAAYEKSVLGYTDQQTSDAILRFGRKPASQSLADVRRFIASYDGAARQVVDMPVAGSSKAE